MGVKVKFGEGDEGSPLILSFTDPFTVDRSRQLYQTLDYGNFTGVTITLGVLVITQDPTAGANGIICTGARDMQDQPSQCIRCTMINAPQLLNRTGLAVYQSGWGLIATSPSFQQFYCYFTHFFTGTINVLGRYPTVPTGNYALALGIGVPAANDVYELFAEDLGAAGNRVRLWQNGVLLADVTDLDANRLVSTYGWPGWNGGGSGAATQTTWDDLYVGVDRP